ncbi:MAG: hypothetical protein K6A63_02095 [Acholeplasmatales bacterium]|nr:hypothetical protein [Acholeplasmatales bacterium]
MNKVFLDEDIATHLKLSKSDIIYHFKKGHIKGVHLDNVGWIASQVEGRKFIRNYLRNKRELKLKKQKQKTLFNYKEK